ncbi:MAG: FMN-binding protein [Peptococcaceae bacterium]|nr:FMN-binding protein [Peptococcaceae bacterium]
MRNKVALSVIAVLILAATSLFGCGQNRDGQMQDGYYTAEAADFSHGWKEFVTILVQDNTIVAVEYNAQNASGFIKAWDMDYMRNMNSAKGTYPNEYTRGYGASLLASQKADEIDAITGATSSYNSFRQLAAAAMERARLGDISVAVVEILE